MNAGPLWDVYLTTGHLYGHNRFSEASFSVEVEHVVIVIHVVVVIRIVIIVSIVGDHSLGVGAGLGVGDRRIDHAVILGAEVRDSAGVHIDIHVILGVVCVELDLVNLTAIVVISVGLGEGRVPPAPASVPPAPHK